MNYRNSVVRSVGLGLVVALAGWAQLPRPFYAWWNSPVRADLNLTPNQKKQIRATITGYHERLVELRADIERAETDLEYQFNQQPVDTQKANEAIGRLAAARAELTKTLSQMSLRLRTVLTHEQWRELQSRRPGRGGGPSEQTEQQQQQK